MKTTKKNSKKTALKTTKISPAKRKELSKLYGPDTKGEPVKEYAGAPIPATQVFRRKMDEFKNCTAHAWMLINREAGTVTHANTYNDVLKPSYSAEHYTYPIKEKVVSKKQEEMEEVEVTDWPEWIEQAKRTRKSK